MTVEKLIEEMTAIKVAYPTLEVSEVLQIFEIQALRELTLMLRRIASG